MFVEESPLVSSNMNSVVGMDAAIEWKLMWLRCMTGVNVGEAADVISADNLPLLPRFTRKGELCVLFIGDFPLCKWSSVTLFHLLMALMMLFWKTINFGVETLDDVYTRSL